MKVLQMTDNLYLPQMAYTDVSTLKAEVPKRSRVVSEQEQAKTDSRRAVREFTLTGQLRS